MLKKLAKSGIATQALVIAILSLVLFFTPQVDFSAIPPPHAAAPMGVWLYELLAGYPHLVKPLAVSLLIIISFLFNAMLIKHDLSPRQSIFPAVLTLMFMLFTPDPLSLIIAEACLLLLLAGMNNMMSIYGQQNPNFTILNATITISIASMLIPEMMIFGLFVWFGLFTFRINSWREWIISLLGLAIPYFYLLFLFLWNDNLSYAIHTYGSFFHTFAPVFNKPGIFTSITLGLLVLSVLVGLTRFLSDAGDKIISIRKKMWVTAQFAFTGFIVILISGDKYPGLLLFIFLPAAAALSYSLMNSRKTWLFDFIILLTVLTAFLNRINP